MKHEYAFLRALVLFWSVLLAAGCGDSATSAVDASTSDGGDGGEAMACGGTAGQTCAADAYCDYSDNLCGNGVMGTCQPRPSACPFIVDPVCACNGSAYDNDCMAAQEGHDVSNAGDCPEPVGAFACGRTFCQQGQTYCERQVSDVVGVPDSYACRPLPSACGGTGSCACLADEPCGAQCVEDGGEFFLTCPGG